MSKINKNRSISSDHLQRLNTPTYSCIQARSGFWESLPSEVGSFHAFRRSTLWLEWPYGPRSIKPQAFRFVKITAMYHIYNPYWHPFHLKLTTCPTFKRMANPPRQAQGTTSISLSRASQHIRQLLYNILSSSLHISTTRSSSEDSSFAYGTGPVGGWVT